MAIDTMRKRQAALFQDVVLPDAEINLSDRQSLLSQYPMITTAGVEYEKTISVDLQFETSRILVTDIGIQIQRAVSINAYIETTKPVTLDIR